MTTPAAWLLLLWVSAGQTALPTGDRLAAPIVDGNFGFSIRPPNYWMVDRQRKANPAGLTVLRLYRELSLGVRFEFSLRVNMPERPLTVDAALDELCSALTVDMKNVQFAERGKRTVDGRPGASVSATFELDEIRTALLVIVVQARPQQFFLFLFSGPAISLPAVEPLFKETVDSFRILGSEESDRKIERALVDGSDWVQGLSTKELGEIKPLETWLGVYRGKSLVGFMQVISARAQEARREGVGVREQGWVFEADGTARRTFNEMFVTFDRQFERWKFVTLAWTRRGPKDASGDVNVGIEEGLLQSGQLFTSQRYGSAAAVESNPAIKAPPTYCPRALRRVLPQLVERLDEPRLLGVHEFDHTVRGLSVTTIETGGTARSAKAGSNAIFYRVREREGLFGTPTDVFVTPAGRPVKVAGPELVLRIMRREDLEKIFAKRVDDAERAIAEVDREYARMYERFASKSSSLRYKASPSGKEPAPDSP